MPPDAVRELQEAKGRTGRTNQITHAFARRTCQKRNGISCHPPSETHRGHLAGAPSVHGCCWVDGRTFSHRADCERSLISLSLRGRSSGQSIDRSSPSSRKKHAEEAKRRTTPPPGRPPTTCQNSDVTFNPPGICITKRIFYACSSSLMGFSFCHREAAALALCALFCAFLSAILLVKNSHHANRLRRVIACKNVCFFIFINLHLLCYCKSPTRRPS